MEEMRKAYPMGDMVMYERKPSPLAGMTVVITGKLWRFTRKEAHQQLLSRGAIVKRTVTKKTDYLVRETSPVPNWTRPLPWGFPSCRNGSSSPCFFCNGQRGASIGYTHVRQGKCVSIGWNPSF